MDITSNNLFRSFNFQGNAAGYRSLQVAPTFTAAPVDTFSAQKAQDNLGILTARQALEMSAQRSAGAATAAAAAGTNIGALGPYDPVVPAATRHARRVAGERVDWSHPERALRQLTQFDGRAEVGGSDPTRCGAAVIVAAGILNGPEAFQEGLSRILDRADNLSEKLLSLSDNQPELGRAAQRNVEKAIDTLSAYLEKSPRKMTNADMSKIQDAIYSIAHADQIITMNGRSLDSAAANDPYLTTNAVGEYFKLMTGAEAPVHGGKSVQPYRVHDAQDHGHFVLADENGNVTYNPWPEANGKAFSRSEGGSGPSIVSGNARSGQLEGKKVSEYPNSLPAR